MPPRPQDEAAARLLDSNETVYFRPVVLADRVPDPAFGDGQPLPLAGGPFAIAGIEVMTRGNRVAGGPVLHPERLRVLAGRAGPERARCIASALDRLSSGRAALADLAPVAPLIMGVINVTPDSFSDGGAFADAEQAIAHGRALAADGADILDIGGESTRPGATPVARDEEMARLLPVIAGLRGVRPLSIDTRHASVMAAALDAGAALINDISALAHDRQSMSVAARGSGPVILMHSRGEPATMQAAPHYDDALLDVYDGLGARIEACEAAGIPRSRLIADPGIGFGKTTCHNTEILRGLSLLHGLGVPIMVGLSRKGLIASLSAGEAVGERLPGSLAGALWAASQGAHVVRVHDVAQTRQALAVWCEFAARGHAAA